MKKNRLEQDSLGQKEVPIDAYYGIQSLRGKSNFPITGYRVSKTFIKSMAYVKKAAALTNLEAGVLDKQVAETIVQVCDELIKGKHKKHFITDPIQGGAGTSMNMNINEVIANRGAEILGREMGLYEEIHPNDHVNYGQSTNDVIPTSGKLTILLKSEALLKELQKLEDMLIKKGKEFDHVIKMGRTHLQDAIPIRLGQEFRAYSFPIQRDIRRIKYVLEDFHYINMGATAVGTGLNADTSYINRIVDVLSEVSGKQMYQVEDLVDGTRNLDSFVWLSSALKILAVNLSKMANDLRFMASGPRAGINEINLPQQQPGSSIMPGKVNPVIPEVINQIAFQVMGNDQSITKAAEAGQMELNVFEPVLFFNIFQSLDILANGVKTLINNCIKGITANEVECERQVKGSVGIITALSPHIGYKNASDIAKNSLKTGVSVEELTLEKGLLTKEELQEILDPYEMTMPGISGKNLLKNKK